MITKSDTTFSSSMVIYKTHNVIFVILLALFSGCASLNHVSGKKRLLYADDFSGERLKNDWAIECNDKETLAVSINRGKMELNSSSGLTVWFKKELQGDILIEYDRVVVINKGLNDRLADANQFWMATDAKNKMFTRKGAFDEYDELKLYYVGMGAHENTVTRMRRYNGTSNRTTLKDLTNSDQLLIPNTKQHIEIKVTKGTSTFSVDGKVFFNFKDKAPYNRGFFGFRLFKSHQLIDNFKVWLLK